MFRAFSDPIRLRILNLVQPGDLCVCDLVEILRLPQPPFHGICCICGERDW